MDLIGQKFNRLTITKKTQKPLNRKYSGTFWLCICDCGNEKILSTGEIKSGNTKSCGCLNIERIINYNKENKKKYNVYDLTGEYGIGYTSKNEEFYFDLEDYDKIKDYSWHLDNKGYVINSKNEKQKICFHRLVMNCEDNLIVDHKNGHKSRNNNRKNNLRICSHKENAWNRKIVSNNKSGQNGVCFSKKEAKWKSSITVNKKKISLGSFNNLEDAIKIRQKAEIEYYGEYKYNNEVLKYEKNTKTT